jgi:hypothetical protein
VEVLTVVGFGAVVIGLRRPVLGVFGMSMLCTLDSVARHLVLNNSAVLRYNTFNYWLLIVILLESSRVLRLRDMQTRILQAFILLLALEIGKSGEWEQGALHLMNILACFGLLAYFVRARPDGSLWYWMGVANGVLGAAGGFVYFLQRGLVPDMNYNAWALFPVTAMFAISLGYHFAPPRVSTRLSLALLGSINSFWVFLSGSRGNVLVAGVCMVYLLCSRRSIAMVLVCSMSLVLLGVAMSSMFAEMQNNSVDRIEKLFDVERSSTSRTSGRSELVLAGWYMFLAHPFGVGTGGYAASRIGEGYVDRGGMTGWRAEDRMQAHAGWIKTLAENGVPGVVLHLSFVFSFAIIGWRRRGERLFAVGLLVTCALSVAFVSTEFQSKGLWFLAAGGMVILHYCAGVPLRAGVVMERWPVLELSPKCPVKLSLGNR